MMIAIASSGMACSSVSLFTLSGFIMAVVPMTMPMLQIYDPRLPIDRSIAP